MKTFLKRPTPTGIVTGVSVAALATATLLSGCQASGNHVIASTATVIGVELGQAPANTSAQAKLGYHRAEFAYVPTNRNAGTTEGQTTVTGAQQSAEVIMELRYGGIFSRSGGIYQRLAVGSEAVRQPGAALMFAKNQEGEIDAEQAGAVKAALAAIESPATDALTAARPVNLAFLEFQSNSQKLALFDAAAKTQQFTDYRDFSARVTKPDQVAQVRAELEKDADIKAAIEKHGKK